MKTSVIITSYCRSEMLQWWFHSLLEHTELPLDDVEFLVINDGFRDETESVANYYRGLGLDIRYLFTGHRNSHASGPVSRPMGYAANIGIRQATGEIVVLTSGDIFHLTATLPAIIKAVEDDPLAIATVQEVHDDDGRVVNLLSQRELGEPLLAALAEVQAVSPLRTDPFRSHRDMPFLLGLRRRHLTDIGGYDEDFYGYACEDSDLMRRLVRHGLHYVYTAGECVHLHHGRRTAEEVHHSAAFQYNLELMQRRAAQVQRNQHRECGVWQDEPGKRPPLQLTMFVTTRCNLACPLCSQSALRRETWDLSLEELNRVIAVCRKDGLHFRYIEVTGGEPTMWPHFYEGVRRLKESGIADDITFITNGNNAPLAVGVSKLYAPWYFVSLQQATPEQVAYHRANGVRVFWNTEVHRPQPRVPFAGVLPCQCGATTSRWGERCVSIAYFQGRAYYCCMAPALQAVTGHDAAISTPWESGFMAHFADKQFDRPICAVCMNNNRIWNRL